MTNKTKKTDTVDAREALDKILGGPVSFGEHLRAIREGDEITLAAFSKKIGISLQNLSDIEFGRKGVSAERAAKWAKLLGYSEAVFVKMALQDDVNRAGLTLTVDVHQTRKRKAA